MLSITIIEHIGNIKVRREKMKVSKKLIIIVSVLILLIGGAVAYEKKINSSSQTSSGIAVNTNNSSTVSSSPQQTTGSDDQYSVYVVSNATAVLGNLDQTHELIVENSNNYTKMSTSSDIDTQARAILTINSKLTHLQSETEKFNDIERQIIKELEVYCTTINNENTDQLNLVIHNISRGTYDTAFKNNESLIKNTKSEIKGLITVLQSPNYQGEVVPPNKGPDKAGITGELSLEDFKVKGITLGMTKPQVIIVLGKPTNDLLDSRGKIFYNNFQIGMGNGISVNYITFSEQESTFRGLKIGDTKERATQIYGKYLQIDDDTRSHITMQDSRGSYFLSIRFKDNIVESLIIDSTGW